MNKYYAKYRFNSKEQFESKRDAFIEYDKDGNKQPLRHFIVGRGFAPETTEITHEDGYKELIITTEEVEIDGMTVTRPKLTNYYLVDVIWKNIEEEIEYVDEVEVSRKGKHPYGWKTYHVKPSNPLLQPLWGWRYNDKMED